MHNESVVIVVVGSGLGRSLARRFAKSGFSLSLVARNGERVLPLVSEIESLGTNAIAIKGDATTESGVKRLFARTEKELGPIRIRIAVYNASLRIRKPVLEISSEEFINVWKISCYGRFLVGREAAKYMIPRRKGSIFFTGATASIKGFPSSAAFAVGKFGLLALAQSMARELQPKGIHVAHFVIDGVIGRDSKGSKLDPDAIAETYYQVHMQHRSSWSFNVELRPWVEKF
jgi:NAD(P)-dependent dehydrogenase (short-subunit alcohol dehydrogenase family)